MSELSELANTLNFESAVYKIFTRIVKGEGPGLMMLWGGALGELTKANKSYFLNMVEILQKGVNPIKPYIPEYLWNLLKGMEPDDYHCLRLIEDASLSVGSLYQRPLSAVLPSSLAGAISRGGWIAGRRVVMLCDNIQAFMGYNQRENEEFLRSLASALDAQTTLTVIGASRMEAWNAEAVLGSGRVVNLGWD